MREARSWIGTPWHHQARVKGVGVDCVGVVIGVARDLGLSGYDVTGYGELPDPAMMGRELRENLIEIPVEHVESGDILWFRIATDPQHVGIVSCEDPMTIVHAMRKPGLVVEVSVDERWRKRIVGAFRFRGLA